jgi:23S rRNA (cytosine1962-C5)-methyltransferase
VLRRHPWLFSGAIASALGDGRDGLAEIRSAEGMVLAHGFYSPASQIRARLWTFGAAPPDEALFRRRFEAAAALRRSLAENGTDGYRLVHSEGDGCPGVIVDRFGETAVLLVLTEGAERNAGALERAASDAFGPKRLIVRRVSGEREGSEGTGARWFARTAEGDPDQGAGFSRAPFREEGLRFFADLTGGQKTGFYFDQRDNRSRLRELSAGRRVLNLFSYTGAFSVAALAGGALGSVDVDSSAPALDLARIHRLENGLPAPESGFVRADVFEDLRRRTAAAERWDIVVCDPPAFAKKRGDLPHACRGYKDLNRLAMSLVEPGGCLLTCSCSGLLSAELFQKVVFSASLEAGARFFLTARQGAGADHPVSLDCPEGEYLKGLWLMRER